MYAIGTMAMPEGFRYRDVFLKGKPRHDRLDSFLIRHPRMSVGQRAKIFAPFDALKGFNEALERTRTTLEEAHRAEKPGDPSRRSPEEWEL